MIILVDIDNTVVDMTVTWREWIEDNCGFTFSEGELLSYKSAPHINLRACGRIFDFWKQADLYDNLEPNFEFLSLLKRMSDVNDIVFVSSLSGNFEHAASKDRFIRKWFKFNSGVIFTDQKHFVKGDILIDDNLKNVTMYKAWNPRSVVIMPSCEDNSSCLSTEIDSSIRVVDLYDEYDLGRVQWLIESYS